VDECKPLNVGALVLLLFFIYSYIGVLTFGEVIRGQSLNEHANFETFGLAMLTLFRVATNDEWAGAYTRPLRSST